MHGEPPFEGGAQELLVPRSKGERQHLLELGLAKGYDSVPAPPYYSPSAPHAKPPPPPPSVHATNWRGVALAFLSGAFFTLSSAAVKALRSVDPMELLAVRAFLQVFAMLVTALWRSEPLLGPKGFRWLLQLQGIVGGLTLVLLFYSFRRLPLGDATTIIFSSPVVVMVLSFIFLKEPCGFFRTLVVFMLVTGVTLISKPPFIFGGLLHEQHYDVVGYACALSATVFTALNMVVMRKCKDVHFSVVVLHLSLWSLVLAVGLICGVGHHRSLWALFHHSAWEYAMCAGVSVLGLSGQVLVACALGHEGAGKVAVTRSLDIVLAFVLQVTVFGEVPDWMSILGAALVLVCVLGMGLEEQVHYLASLVP